MSFHLFVTFKSPAHGNCQDSNGGHDRMLILFFTISNRIGVYIASILSTTFFMSYFLIFWSSRSATLSGTTATAFTLAFQSALAQIGTVLGPQLFEQKWAHNRHRNSFIIGAVLTIVAFLGSLWTWYSTRNIEYDAMRVRREILKARAEGKVHHSDKSLRRGSFSRGSDGTRRRKPRPLRFK